MTLPPFLASRRVAVALLSLCLASLCALALGSDTPVVIDPLRVAAEAAAEAAAAEAAASAASEAKAAQEKKKKKKKKKKSKSKSKSKADDNADDSAESKVEPEPPPEKTTLDAARAADEADAMDLLRARLADKLGAAKNTVETKNGELRVSTAALPQAASTVTRSASAASPRVLAVPASASAARSAPIAPAAAVAASAVAHRTNHAAHWDYTGSGGPERWGNLKPEFAKCSNGARQSPIDIRDGLKVQLDPVHFEYKPSAFRVIDNGHTVQVNLAAGNFIEVMGRRYELVQFHFHRPSEERINGRQFDMVAHLVHKDIEGRLAVVAVLLEQGGAQPVVQMVWNNLPLEKNEEMPAQTPIDLDALLPAERSYFTYMGSLTTPPCSEGVLWMVMKTPVAISPEQIGIFARLYPMNARPIQSSGGRMIKESH